MAVYSPNDLLRRGKSYSPGIRWVGAPTGDEKEVQDTQEGSAESLYPFWPGGGFLAPAMMSGEIVKSVLKDSLHRAKTDVGKALDKSASMSAPEATGITIPQTALGLLLAAFDHSGVVTAGYLRGLQQGKQQEFDGRQAAYENSQRKLGAEIERQKRWIQILSGGGALGD